MKVVIAGSRTIKDLKLLENAIVKSGFVITEVISGLAAGADTLGKEWAESKSLPVLEYPAQWDKYGRSAGYRRNEEMAKAADAVIVIWDGISPGSRHMIDIAKNKRLPLYVYNVATGGDYVWFTPSSETR